MIRVSRLFHIVFKGNLKTHFVITMEVLFRSKEVLCLLLSKSLPEFHLHIIRINRFEVTATRSYIADNLNLKVGF